MDAGVTSKPLVLSATTWRGDLFSGLTVALVAIPQCMAFAVIAGLQPVTGIYTAIVMTLVAAAFSSCPRLVLGPNATTSTLIFAALVSAAPHDTPNWPGLAAEMAILVGLLTILAAMLHVGDFVRFVSRPVLDGFFAGAAALIVTSQLGPALGLPSIGASTLGGMLWAFAAQASHVEWASAALSVGVVALIALGARFTPTIPTPFIALLGAGIAAAELERRGIPIATIAAIPRELPTLHGITPSVGDNANLFIGVLALALVGIVQTVALARKLASGPRGAIDARRELITLGVANVAAGVVGGFVGAGSFARSVINERGGARTRLTSFISAIATAVIVWIAAPWARHVPKAAIAALLIWTALGSVQWSEMARLFVHDRRDRIVLSATMIAALIAPIHWAILIGLAISIAIFIRRASRLQIFEMVRDESEHYHERLIDSQTGAAAITLLQIQGPLFFAHADELADTLQGVFERGPRIVIIRMRRTQQLDYSVIVALSSVMREYEARGGRVILCGLTLRLRRMLLASPLREVIPPQRLLRVTGQVFGSARRAIDIAKKIVSRDPPKDRPLFRVGAVGGVSQTGTAPAARVEKAAAPAPSVSA